MQPPVILSVDLARAIKSVTGKHQDVRIDALDFDVPNGDIVRLSISMQLTAQDFESIGRELSRPARKTEPAAKKPAPDPVHIDRYQIALARQLVESITASSDPVDKHLGEALTRWVGIVEKAHNLYPVEAATDTLTNVAKFGFQPDARYGYLRSAFIELRNNLEALLHYAATPGIRPTNQPAVNLQPEQRLLDALNVYFNSLKDHK